MKTGKEANRLKALEVVINRARASKLQKHILRKKVRKLSRTGQLDTMRLDEDWRHRLCVARMILGDFSDYDGWQFRDDFSKTFHNYPINRWNGTEVPIYIFGEQGLGDEIMYSSILPELISRFGHENVIYDGDERLSPIISRSFGIKARRRFTLKDYYKEPLIAGADLVRFFRKDLSHFPGKPFLKPNPEYVEYWKQWLHDKPKIGLAWKGRQGEFLPRELYDGEAIDLQYGDHAQVEGLIIPPVDHIKEVDKSFALVACLDKVISVPQTIIHYAGSQGITCDVIIPPSDSGEIDNSLDWSFSSNMPWYNSVKVYGSLYEYQQTKVSKSKRRSPSGSRSTGVSV